MEWISFLTISYFDFDIFCCDHPVVKYFLRTPQIMGLLSGNNFDPNKDIPDLAEKVSAGIFVLLVVCHEDPRHWHQTGIEKSFWLTLH